VAGLRMTTQIVAAASSDPSAARRDAAAQVGFYSTPKGYDALFPDGQFAAERVAARDAVARGDVPSVIAAGEAMVEERAVFGTDRGGLGLDVLTYAAEACTSRHVRFDRSWPARRRDSRSR